MSVTERYDLWREILSVARYAPSPHNVQPWRVRLLSEREADLFFQGERMLPKEDRTGSFLLAAMGTFLEAVDLLAAQKGMRLAYTLRESAAWFAAKASTIGITGLIPFASLQLVDAPDAAVTCTAELFMRRRTCRQSLRPQTISAGDVSELSALAEAWEQQYIQTDVTEQIERILARNIDAVFEDLNLPLYHDEITSWFRFTDEAAQEHRDGLDRRCMNVSRGEFWLSARLPKLLLFPPIRALLKRRYRRQLGVIPTMGMLSGQFFVPEKSLDSGRFLLRFWLEVTRKGLYLHPYGNMVTNPGAAGWLRKEIGVDDVWLVFKLGYADEPPQSYRRTLEQILISEGQG